MCFAFYVFEVSLGEKFKLLQPVVQRSLQICHKTPEFMTSDNDKCSERKHFPAVLVITTRCQFDLMYQRPFQRKTLLARPMKNLFQFHVSEHDER